MNNKRCGIGIDTWKLDIFTKVINEAGYTFTRKPGPTKDTLMLYIEIPESEVGNLANVVVVANNRAAKSKAKGWN